LAKWSTRGLENTPMKTIGLCMIVKNEAAVITRCLESVRPLVDYVLIEDTGSTDGTQQLVRRYLDNAKLPGEVFDEPWRDFAYNRSLALKLLRDKTEIDYALIMDADDRLVLEDGFDPQAFKETMTAEMYHLWIRLGSVRYHRPQICSNQREFRFRGVVHEFLQGPDGGCSQETAHGLHIAAGVEGARSQDPDKYHKDAERLEAALRDETDAFMRSRYTYYLAQSCRDSGQKEKALDNYLKRAELGFWDEEVFVSLYCAGKLQAELGRPYEDVIASYLRATETVPRRAEALHAASVYCRGIGKNREGMEFARRGLALPEPANGLLIEAWVYDYGLLDEFAVNAYWAGESAASLEACEKLLQEGKIPEGMRPRVIENAAFARKQLASAPANVETNPMPDDVRLPIVAAPAAPKLTPMPQTTIATSGANPDSPLAALVKQAFDAAMAGHGEFNPMMREFEGAPGQKYRMSSGRKYRLFINNFVRSLDDARYLEIGSFSGSTMCSVIAENKVRALAIDNWSQFGGPYDLFIKNTGKLRDPKATLDILKSDYRAVDYGNIGKFNIYMFDGPHSDLDHYDAMHLVLPALDDEFIFIVDDWDWPQVRNGTLRAIEACGLQIDFAIDIRTSMDGTTPAFGGEWSDWHNGYFLAVLTRSRGDAGTRPAAAPELVEPTGPAEMVEPVRPLIVMPARARATPAAAGAEAPRVLLAILAKQKAELLPFYLACIEALDYPKSSIVLYVRTNNNTDRTADILQDWLDRVGYRYAGIEFDRSDVAEPVQRFGVHEWNPVRFKVLAKIRQDSLAATARHDCDFYFVADVDNFILPNTLKELAALNLPIVAPLIRHQDLKRFYANYHEKVDANGYFLNSDEYYSLLYQKIKGAVEVAVVHCTYLVRADVIPQLTYDDGSQRYEYVIFSDSARRAGIPQYLDNRSIYGYLTLDEEFKPGARLVGPRVGRAAIDTDSSLKPCLMVCFGLQSSGSTWMFNLVREISRAEDRPFKSLYADKEADLPWEMLGTGLMVVKSHQPTEEFRKFIAKSGGTFVLTVRDPRDSVVSLMRRFDYDFPTALDFVTLSAHRLTRLAAELKPPVFRYEDGFVDRIETFDKIAALLGACLPAEQRERILAALTPERVKATIGDLVTAGRLHADAHEWDPELAWHPRHVGDGKIGKFSEALTAEQQQMVLKRTAEFCRRFDYGQQP
jgi:glycosyltransferase involved in cell wall biosynthesis